LFFLISGFDKKKLGNGSKTLSDLDEKRALAVKAKSRAASCALNWNSENNVPLKLS
jgi:hypothetical protein